MFKTNRRNDGIWKRAAHGLSAFVVILALAAALMPAFSPDVNAQDCPVGQVLDENGICVPEAEVDGGQPNSEVVEGDPNVDPAQDEASESLEDTPVSTPEGGVEGDTEGEVPVDPAALQAVPTEEPGGEGYVTVHKYDCGADPDVAIKTLEELRGSCAPAAGIVFGVTNLDAGDTVLTSEEFGTDASGVAAFAVPNPYTVIINEVIPGGYGDPLAYCGYPANPDNALYQYFPSEGALYFSLGAGEQLYCDWFNTLPAAPADQGTESEVWIVKYECNDSPALSVGSPLPNLDDYGCDLVDGVTFDVSDGATSQNGVTGASGPGELVLGPFGGQVVAITETVPAGHGYGDPVVYCDSFAGEGPDLLTQVGTAGAAVDLNRVEGEHIVCYFLNILVEESDETDAIADIIVHKYECDADPAPNPGDDIPAAFQQAGCTVMDGVDFTVEGQGTNFSDTRTTGADGPETVQWLGLNTAPAYSIFETVPAGYDTPIPYCIREIGPTTVFVHQGPVASIGFLLGEQDEIIECWWANVPVEEGEGDITIHKYECTKTSPPVLLGRDGIDSALQKAGCTTMDGVEFTLSEINGPVLDVKLTGADGPGTIFWNLAAPNGYTVTETVPDGYATPVKYCWLTDAEDTTPYIVPTEGNSIDLEVAPGDHFVCYWINIPADDDGSITIYKYTCPVGYDLNAPSADPGVDCTAITNGVEFFLNGSDAQVTGQQLESAVKWEGLSAGDYTVTESVPAGIGYVFVLECYGNSIPMIQGYPLSLGPDFALHLASGDQIGCQWFNVPESPDSGTVTVIKYGCVTAVFVSTDACQIYEGGAGFELSAFDGSQWSYVASGTTNASGVHTFNGLAAGLYQVDETTGAWCHAVADYTDQDGYLVVSAGQETTVWVYNCNVTVSKLPPTKYPNTGAGNGAATVAAANAPVLPQDAPGMIDPRQWAGVLDSRLIAPFLAGDKPVQIRIEAIELEATIETLEIVDGEFQDPTTSDEVAWYKDTARLGEAGNLVMAGHLNYWGDPEGVFFALDQVKQGDVIEVTAEDGTAYRYEVTTVSQQTANSETLREITEETGGQTLTLITCGGQWDPGLQSYLHRTVVQAELTLP